MCSGYALFDCVRALRRAPIEATLHTAVDAWSLSFLALTCVAVPLFALHGYLLERTERAPRLAFALGALEGFGLSLLGLVVDDMMSLPLPQTALIVLAATLLGGALACWGRLLPARLALLYVVGAIAAIFLGEHLGMRQKLVLRLVLDLVALGAFVQAIRMGLREPSSRTQGGLRRFALGALACAVALRLFAPTRPDHWLVQHSLIHARSFLLPLELTRTVLQPVAVGERRCASGGETLALDVAPASTSGSACGADVVLLSFDALRADALSELRELQHDLQPNVTFQRAVSPAPRTTNSLAATLRGRAVRQVPFESRPPHESVPQDGPPTIATALVAQGYRAVYIPTHRYLVPERRVAAGFEGVSTSDAGRMFERVSGAWDTVPAKSVFTRALEVAEDTQKPLLLWMHLMESHAPYRHGDGMGPPTPEGHRRALRDLDRAAAAFLRRLRGLRERPVVVAVFGDHGEEFGEHGASHHSTTVYGEQVRVALLLHADKLPNASIDAPVSTAALPATVLDLLGTPPLASFRTPSLLGCIERPSSCPELAVSEQHAFGSWVGYTGSRYRLLVETKRGIEQLFDSHRDPNERYDLAPTRPALLAEMRDKARTFDRAHCTGGAD